jgi:diguanylate cyclase (GGDEF)-like protein/PAS domain S-box-containing protein
MKFDNTLHLLIVDESSNDAEMITSILRNAGHAVRATRVEDDEDLQDALGKQAWDMVISADRLTYIDALKVLEIIRKAEKDIPVIVAANANPQISISDALKAGARDYITKDEEPEHLQFVVARELGSLNDRRKLRKFSKSMNESEKRCRTLLDSSRDAITYVHEGMHIYANPVYLEMFGYADQDEIDGMPIMDMVAPNDHDTFKKFLRSFSNREDEMQGEIEVKGIKTDSTEFNAVMEFSPATIEGEACTQIIIRSQQDKELEKKLNILSKQDLLTGVCNRQYFMEILDIAVYKAMTEAERSALLYIEIDEFLSIKENVGISASDLVLSDIAEVLKIVTDENETLSRFADHTFTLLLKNRSNEETLEIADKVCKAIEDNISNVSGQTVTYTCSIGISTIGENTGNAQEVLTRADVACNIAHEAGGNKVHLHNPIADEKASLEHDATWTDAIRHALDNDAFYLVFQPIVSLHGDTKENYEVLIRMRGEGNVAIMPDKFMSAAVKGDLITQIDRWVIENSLKRLASEHAKGKKTNFFIKLSGRSLTDHDLLPWISEQIKEQRVSGDTVIFEINESDAMMHLNEAKGFINGIKQLRCQIVLEDFGSGLNSIKGLKHLNADFLKIDGALIHELSTDSQNQDTVKSIIQTAHSMGKLTIAEFVQDANSLALLWQFGVNYIEGYFLQEPSTELEYDFTAEN